MPAFARTIGIDYSGVETPTASLKGLRVYLAEGDAPPMEVPPPSSPRKYWTRKGIAEWLVERLAEDVPTLVGIDHGFSFPLRYFEVHGLKPDWPAFLDDFQRHWPTDDDHAYVDFVREDVMGNGAARNGNARWRRLTEERAGGAKSVFLFDVQGSVAKSTHAGIPWLRFTQPAASNGERIGTKLEGSSRGSAATSAEVAPQALFRQLKDGGRLVKWDVLHEMKAHHHHAGDPDEFWMRPWSGRNVRGRNARTLRCGRNARSGLGHNARA